MENIYTQTITVRPQDCGPDSAVKLSALLQKAQEISGKHCEELGFDWNTMQQQGLFWAVLRHKIYIHEFPKAGQAVILQTWPMPTTRSAFPRAVRGCDESGNILFEVISLWVVMNTKTRSMVLPGKTGIQVPGILRGGEPESPGSLLPGQRENITLWQVSQEDLDQNGHVNNTRYVSHVEPLAAGLTPREVTVCYLAEVLPGEELALHWTLSGDGSLTVDGHRTRTDVPQKTERVFALKLLG